ncbi:hypothetical protein HK098_001899 [Nowakowskiella sp. JEL0407]|nr:hypothetical protein HK098_001899 [Nowakowskiella sp. JEL0407]
MKFSITVLCFTLFAAIVSAAAVDIERRSIGSSIVSAAMTHVGKTPYAWGGGHGSKPGASKGTKQSAADGGCDDRGTVGLDCSGLTRYAVYKALGTDLLGSGNAASQATILRKSSRAVKVSSWSSVQPGDIMYFGSDYHHTAIVKSGTGSKIQMVEEKGHDKCKSLMAMVSTVRSNPYVIFRITK